MRERPTDRNDAAARLARNVDHGLAPELEQAPTPSHGSDLVDAGHRLATARPREATSFTEDRQGFTHDQACLSPTALVLADRCGLLEFGAARLEVKLMSSATDHACPNPPLITCTDVGRSHAYDALCQGTTAFTSIWGDGIIDALAAVTGKK